MTRLQLSLSAKDLKNISPGFGSVSDPFAVVTIRGNNPDNEPTVIGSTEVAFNNLNPAWAAVTFLDYKFGVPCYIEVGVFDFDARHAGMSERELQLQDAQTTLRMVKESSTRELLRTGKFQHRVMGTALFEVGEIIGSRNNIKSKSLQKGGVLYAHAERSRKDGLKGSLYLQLRANNLKNLQSFSRVSSPFYEIFRRVERHTDSEWVKVYKSQVVRRDLNPTWDRVKLDVEAVCNGDISRSLKFIIWDHRKTGRHKLMGEFETSLGGLTNAGGLLETVEGRLLVKRHENPAGYCEVIEAFVHTPIEQDPSTSEESESAPAPSIPPSPSSDRPVFVDYLSGHFEMSLAVAIDFTSSNGNPMDDGTLHHFHTDKRDATQWNDYEKAIFAVSSILAKYDSDQKFPVWGFGAKYNNKVRHCFQCGADVEVKGVQGIMDAYHKVFKTPLTMSGPTVFTEVIDTARLYVKHQKELAQGEGKLSYTILLILTAGNVEDAIETKKHLIAASEEPLSVVIVGIGRADFSKMEFLDSFDAKAESGRDITKFVSFNEYSNYNDLTEAVLDEIPDQVVEYYFDRQGIRPGPIERYDQDQVSIQSADEEDRFKTFLGKKSSE